MRPVAWLLLLAAPGLAHAAAPSMIPVQGTLTDADGAPITGDLSVAFTLYSAADGAESVWTETQTVTFDNGSFTAYLGTSTALDLAVFRDHSEAWLGIAVDGDDEMDLLEIATVPYAGFAQYAGDAATVGGLAADQILTTDSQADLEGWAADVCFDTKDELTAALAGTYLAADYVPDWSHLTSVPTEIADGDDDTLYGAATGLTLDGNNLFSVDAAWVAAQATGVCYDSEAELTAALDDNYLPASYVPAWSAVSGIPAGFADGTDADTQYKAGAGLKLDEATGTFSVDSAKAPTAATYTHKVKIGSQGLNSSVGNHLIRVNGATVLSTGRSYGLVVVDRATGAVDSAGTYDVYGSPTNAQALADKLNAIGPDKIVIVNTQDEPAGNRTANGLGDAMMRCGASRSLVDGFYIADGTRVFRYRSAYAMVGICGMGPGTGSEWYSGDVDNDTTAFVDASVLIMDGDVIGSH